MNACMQQPPLKHTHTHAHTYDTQTRTVRWTACRYTPPFTHSLLKKLFLLFIDSCPPTFSSSIALVDEKGKKGTEATAMRYEVRACVPACVCDFFIAEMFILESPSKIFGDY